MTADLECVRGALDGYLDVKRLAFPRFHFLAADDLLEMMGPSRDPQSVQPHLKKCFEGERNLALPCCPVSHSMSPDMLCSQRRHQSAGGASARVRRPSDT